nr:MAG: hypothetical protein [Microvirus sp.]
MMIRVCGAIYDLEARRSWEEGTISIYRRDPFPEVYAEQLMYLQDQTEIRRSLSANQISKIVAKTLQV